MKPTRQKKEGGIISLSLRSQRQTGRQFLRKLANGWGERIRVSPQAKSVLKSPHFKTSKGKQSFVIVPAKFFDQSEERTTRKVRAFAQDQGFSNAKPESVGLILGNFSKEELEEMGLWTIVAMEPINGTNGEEFLTGGLSDAQGKWIEVYPDRPAGGSWPPDVGFVFSLAS